MLPALRFFDPTGYYHDLLYPELEQLLEYMVIEVSPCSYMDYTDDNGDPCRNPIQLLDVAWKKYLESPTEYPAWEAEAVKEYLDRESILLTT